MMPISRWLLGGMRRGLMFELAHDYYVGLVGGDNVSMPVCG
jgi:hypothetical protein